MIKKELRTKWIFYVTLLFCIMLLETTLLPNIKIFGAAPTHLLPYSVAVIAMFEGVVGGALAGLFAGVISDIMLSTPDGFFTITFVLCGILVAFLCKLVFWRNYWTTLLYFIAVILTTRLVYYIVFFLIYGNLNMLSLFYSVPAELFATGILTPIVYPIIRKIYELADFEEEV